MTTLPEMDDRRCSRWLLAYWELVHYESFSVTQVKSLDRATVIQIVQSDLWVWDIVDKPMPAISWCRSRTPEQQKLLLENTFRKKRYYP